MLANMTDRQKESGDILYVKFSYLPEDRMLSVGKRTVSFGKILSIMAEQNRARCLPFGKMATPAGR